MLFRSRAPVLSRPLGVLGPAAVAAMKTALSTGTFVVSQPLNYRGGARVNPADSSGTEKAFEPATGTARDGPRCGAPGRGGSRTDCRAWGGPGDS